MAAAPPARSGRSVRRLDAVSRYELVEDDVVIGVADFHERGNVVVLPHTLIERSRQGGGLGAELVTGVLDDLRARGNQVVAACWYVQEFMEEHPEYRDLLAS